MVMGIEIENLKGFAGGCRVAAKPCDSCKSAGAAVFCRVDSAFLCLNCDSRIHNNKLGPRHERYWMCEVCEQAPAAVTCKADAAALCVSCDADIHSANPLAQRHERVSIEPFFDSAESIVKSSPFNFLVPTEDVEAGSWLLPNPNLNLNSNSNSKVAAMENSGIAIEIINKSGDLFYPEMDPFTDFDFQNSIHHDGVVPVQTKPATISAITKENCFDIDFCRTKLSSLGYPTPTFSQSVSSSSHDVGVVPDGNISDISYPFGGNMTDPSGTLPCSAAAASQAAQLGGIDREARVLRYREKRKNRKFEKTIRYASRKAYAETRPRIKGRFAKRGETETEAAAERNLFGSGSAFFADAQYGVVPSFL